jgi:hypothetical protein
MWNRAYEGARYYEDAILRLDFADRLLNYVRREAPTLAILVETPIAVHGTKGQYACPKIGSILSRWPHPLSVLLKLTASMPLG